MLKRPSSSIKTPPNTASPKNAQVPNKNIEEVIATENEDIKKVSVSIEIENNKDLLNTNCNSPISNIKEKSGKKTVKVEKDKNNTETMKIDEASEKPKRERHYNVEATRNFMKQKRNERQQMAQLTKSDKSKTKDKSEIKKKLQELRNRQLTILKHSTKRKAEGLPDWVGLGSAESTAKKEETEPVLVTSVEKSAPKRDFLRAKPRRLVVPSTKKSLVSQQCVTPAPPPPTSFYVDMNFPAEFLTDDRLGLTKDELKQINTSQANATSKKAKENKVTSNVQAQKFKSSVDKYPVKNNDVNEIFQEEIKQGLEATNEFMHQVSQQMKLLTEHFKLIGDSRTLDPGERTAGVQTVSLKDSAVQAFSSSLSESSQGKHSCQSKGAGVTSMDEWKDILPAVFQDVDNKKRKSSQSQKSNILTELFDAEELFAIPDSIKSQELMSLVRRKLDFIQQEQNPPNVSQEQNPPHLENRTADLSLGLFPLHDTEFKGTAISEYAPMNNEDVTCYNICSPSSLKLSEHSLSKNCQKGGSQKLEINKEINLPCYQEKGNGDGKSDTTISESLSTDPLKLPDNVENLSLTVEGLKKTEKTIDVTEQKNVSMVENGNLSNKFDVKLDTNSIEGLQIRTPALFGSVKSRSHSTSSRSFSEISDRASVAGSQSASKVLCLEHSKSEKDNRKGVWEQFQPATGISGKLNRSHSSKSNISRFSSNDDFKSLKESIEECLQSSKSTRSSLENPLTEKISHGSNKGEVLKTSQCNELSVLLSNNDELSKNRKLNYYEEGLSVQKKNISMEDIHTIKSDSSHYSSPKAYSENKVKSRKHSYLTIRDSERLKAKPDRLRENLLSDQINEEEVSNIHRKQSEYSASSDHSDTNSSRYHEKIVEKFDKRITPSNREKSNSPKAVLVQHDLQKNATSIGRTSQFELRTANSDSSSGFELLQPSTSLNLRHRTLKSKRRLSSEKNLQEMFTGRVPFPSPSSNSAQVGSSSFQDHINKEMENLDAVNTNLAHALARSRALSTENLVNFSNPSTSVSAGISDIHYYPLQLSQSDTTNNQSVGSSGLVEARRDMSNGFLADHFEDPSFNLSKFSLRMLENLLIDEELRYRNQASLLDLRYQAVLEKTEAELTMLSIEKAKHKARGNEETLRNIKKRERGIILKCQQDFKEIKRLHDVGKEASRDRILLFKSQIHLLKSHLSSNKYAQKFRSPNIGKNTRKSSHSPSKSKHNSKSVTHFATQANLESQKRELERREAMLAARRESLEAVMSWTKRVEDEEKRLKDVEKMITLSSASRQVIKQGVDRGTSPLNLVCDSEFIANKTVESSASSSEQPVDIKQNRKSTSDKSMDNYSDTFEQATLSECTPQVKVSGNQANDAVARRKSTIAIKVPLSPRCPPSKRRYSSGSDESILFSQNETSETSDIEVRVSTLQQQLKQRKTELDVLKRQHSKSQREKLRATEQALISQINAYDGYIDQLKNEIKQELDSGSVKVMKPQIKQPKVAERRKSEQFIVKKETELVKETVAIEEVDLSESTESVKTLVESPRVLEDSASKSFVEDSLKTELDTQPSDENRLDSLDPELSDQNINFESSLIQTEGSLKSVSDLNVSGGVSKIKIDSDVVSGDSENTLTDIQVSENIPNRPLDGDISEQINTEVGSIGDVKQSETEIIIKSQEIFSEALEEVESLSAPEVVDNDKDIKSESVIEDVKEIAHDVNEIVVKDEVDLLSTESSNHITPSVLEEIDKDSLKSEISSISDSDEVKTESLIRSLISSDDKHMLKLQVDVTVKSKNETVSLDLEESESEISSSHEKNDSEIGTSLGTNLSNIDLLDSSALPNLDISPISSLHSGENVQLMSAALMRAIEATKEEVAHEQELSELQSTIKDEHQVEEVEDDTEVIKPVEKVENIEKEGADVSEVISAEVEIQNEINEEIPEEIESSSLILDHNISSSPCNATFIVNNDESFNKSDNISKETACEDLMLQMISDSLSDSERLWNLNLEEYRKIREETPFLTALQRENDISNTIDSVSQQLFRNLYEKAIADVFDVYFNKKECAVKDQLEDGYHVPDFDYSEDDTKEAEEEKFWCNASCGERKETPPTQDEAEKLRLKQLQIEQEIEELEAAGMRGFYLRAIPNKPPPPYTPPRPVKSRPSRQIITQAVDIGVNALWESDSDGLNTLRPPSTFLPDMTSSSDIMFRDMMWDLCIELYRKALPPPALPSPSWLQHTKRRKLPPKSKEVLISWCTRQANIVFGYEPTVKKESMIIRWSHKKRDRVDKILIRENQEEESDWTDYTAEENKIKSRIADTIIEETIDQATKAIINAFLRKIPS